MDKKQKFIFSDHIEVERVNVLASVVFAAALVIMIVGAFTARSLIELLEWAALAAFAIFADAVLAFLAGASESDPS